MVNHRTYTDDQLVAAVKSANSWSGVLVALGKARNANAANIRETARRLDLDTSHFGYMRSMEPRPAVEIPFSRPASPGSRSGLSVACRWFLDRGYAVSIPLEHAPYDLVAESDTGLKRIQVKTTKQKTKGRRAQVRLLRTVYDSARSPNSAGRYRQVPYAAGTVDLFFICTDTDDFYLIPFEVVSGLSMIVLDDKYQAFKVCGPAMRT